MLKLYNLHKKGRIKMGRIFFERRPDGMYVVNSLVYPEMVNNPELMIGSYRNVEGLLIIRTGNFRGRPSFECRVNGLVQLSRYLGGTVSKRKFLDIIYKAIQIMKGCKRNRLNLNNLYFHKDFMFIEPNSGRLFCIYFPVISIQNAAMPYMFFKQIAFNVLFDGGDDRAYVYDYINFFKNPNGFSLEEFENFIVSLSGKNTPNNNSGFAKPVNLQNPHNLKSPQNLQSLQVSQNFSAQNMTSPRTDYYYSKPAAEVPDFPEKKASSLLPDNDIKASQKEITDTENNSVDTKDIKNKKPVSLKKEDIPATPDADKIAEIMPPADISTAPEKANYDFEKADTNTAENTINAVVACDTPKDTEIMDSSTKTTEILPTETTSSHKIKICDNCGSENESSAVFCFECGKRFGKTEDKSSVSDEVKICDNCGSENENSAVFCFECGKRFGKTEDKSSVSDEVKICDNCGSENESSAVFCFECGKRLDKSEDTRKSASFENEDTDAYDKTSILSGNFITEKYPYLIRVRNGEKIIINKPLFKIGREKASCDYAVDNNRAVSRTHAAIITRNNCCYITDLGSVNKTYVNDVIIPPQKEVEISPSNSHISIKLADEEFQFFTEQQTFLR